MKTKRQFLIAPASPIPLSKIVDLLKRKNLPHVTPLWVDPHKEIYFITINCRPRFAYGTDRSTNSARLLLDAAGNQLAMPEISTKLFETVRHRQEKLLWWPHLFLLMPDHVHALLSFPPSAKTIQSVITNWKEWTARELGIAWQRDFFEHRLRSDESRRQKAGYILDNPVRKGFVARREDWPFVYFATNDHPPFTQ